MNSIRNKLLIWLLPSFLALYCLAAFSLYQAEKNAMQNDLKEQVKSIAGHVKMRLFRPHILRNFGDNNAQLEKIEELLAEFSANRLNQPLYYKMFDGKTNLVFQSENFQQQELKIDPTKIPPAIFEYKTDNVKLFLQTVFLSERRSASKKLLVLGLDSKIIKRKLKKLKRRLIIGGALSIIVFTGLLVLILRRTLKPIAELAHSVSTINVDNLQHRFSQASIPEEIKPLIIRLNELMVRLESSFERERRFSSDIAHEIRTPLAAIRTTAEVAQKWPSDDINEEFSEIELTSIQLQKLVDSLLMLSRLEAQPRLNIESIDIIRHLDKCIDLRKNNILDKQLQLTSNLADIQIYEIDSDPSLLQMILSNLIGNAICHAPVNSNVEIKLNTDENSLLISNLAPSLTQTDLSVMFDRFWQQDKARQLDGHSGLGLSIAKRSADILNIKLTVELIDKQENQQICFKIKF